MRWNVSDDRELLYRLGEVLRTTREPSDGRVEWLRREVAARRPGAAPTGGSLPVAVVAGAVVVAAVVAGLRTVRRRRGRPKRRRVVRVVIPARRIGKRER